MPGMTIEEATMAKARRRKETLTPFIAVASLSPAKRDTLGSARASRADRFEEQLHESLQHETFYSRSVKIARHANVYTCGDEEEMIYFIESGRIKLLILSTEGKECLLAIHGAGDLFGESCLCGPGSRPETATAMEEAVLRKIPAGQFLARLSRDSLLEGFVRYLAARIADQQQVIANLVTVNSEQRLGRTLLELARTLGKKGQQSTRIELKISHDELSEMVGTTRPRISVFMQRFRDLGLIEPNRERFLVINEKKLTDYLAQIPLEQKAGFGRLKQISTTSKARATERHFRSDLSVRAG